MSNVMGIFVKFCLFFYDARLPNMAMSRDHDTNFENFLFCPNSTFNIRKGHKISSGKTLYFRSYQQKPHGGGKRRPVPLGLIPAAQA